MSVITNSFFKSVTVTVVVVIASIGFAFITNPTAVFIPRHQFEFQLTDVADDVNVSYLDIIEYGSYKQGKNVVLYIEVATEINHSTPGPHYWLTIVAKYPNDDTAHIYWNEVYNGTEQNYQSDVAITGNRLEVAFSIDKFIPKSYMVGIEVRASGFISEDSSPSARDNPLKTRFLGII
ncbi:MAG: hypothetical protein JSW11_21575 [Candidatus Heimdallarchaeota archaeon]|nr:MAG: hypothetical protein JSW11_21575 [Candidatus Heimdallarchaeota archaeon]